MSLEEIRNSIELKDSTSWMNRSKTNCYLFAMGLDLDALNIQYKKCSSDDESLCQVDDNGYLSWIIAMYNDKKNHDNFHFLRKTPEGIWIHQRGYMGPIEELNAKDLEYSEYLHQYEYEKIATYNLSLKKQSNLINMVFHDIIYLACYLGGRYSV